ncbi:SNF2 family amino-terminal protein, partial [Trifolium medium]|nr:SNF2 family amino-terminal protein [Trifolium medium]
MEDLDKQKMVEDKPNEDYKGRINIQNGVKKESTENNGLNQRVKSTPMPNKLPLAQYLAELYRSNKEGTMKNESTVLEMNDDGVNQKDTQQPPVRAETPSLIWSLKRVVPKTKEEEELDKELEKNKPLWDEMERAIRESEAESEIGNLGTNRSPSPQCEHITLLDEQLGVYCKLCGDVITE